MGSAKLVSGVVHDRSGAAISGARVYFTSGPGALPDIAALTGSDGGFTLSAPLPGKYTVQCAADGFDTREVTVTVSAGEAAAKLDIELAH
jgi:hypothetical protein